jgi:hypothetical protein
MERVICMAKIKFQKQEAKNKQKIKQQIYIYIYPQFSMPSIVVVPTS